MSQIKSLRGREVWSLILTVERALKVWEKVLRTFGPTREVAMG